VTLEGRGGEGAAGLPVAAPTAAAAAPAPALPAAIGLLLATNSVTMDEGEGLAWRLPRGACGLCGSGGESGRRFEAGGLGGVRSEGWRGLGQRAGGGEAGGLGGVSPESWGGCGRRRAVRDLGLSQALL